MDRLIKRVRHAERIVRRRNAKLEELEAKAARKARLKYVRKLHQEVHRDKMAQRDELRRQWDVGPMAPRVEPAFVVDNERIAPPVSLLYSVVDRRCAWAGGRHRLCLAPGDRVVILEGPDQGRIDTIDEVEPGSGTVRLSRLHRVTIHLPGWVLEAQRKSAAGSGAGRGPEKDTGTRAAAIPISSVRLVHPLPDPATGQHRDVVIRELRPATLRRDDPLRRVPSFEQWEYGRRWERVVPGLNVRIPWPEPAEPERKRLDADTAQIDVERRTFVPTLLGPPMPAAVIDELRGRYSKFRTRHEQWYLAKVEARDMERKLAPQTMAEMRTPLQDLHRKRRDMRRARGQPELGDDVLERIGRLMEQNRLADVEAGRAAKIAREDGINQITEAMQRHTIAMAAAAAAHSEEEAEAVLDGRGPRTAPPAAAMAAAAAAGAPQPPPWPGQVVR